MEKKNVKMKRWKAYGLFLFLTEGLGALIGFLTRKGMEAYKLLRKPPLTPPGWLFPVVWSILYALMAIGAARVFLYGKAEDRKEALLAFFVQLFLNLLWTPVFFSMQAFASAFLLLLLLLLGILWMIRSFFRIDPLWAKLQIPYLLWVCFAGYLNFGIWMLNR